MVQSNGNGHRHFDLDAAKIARAETRGESPTITFGGEAFVLPAELPAEFAYLLDNAKEAMRVVFGDDFDRFWKHGPSREDLEELVVALTRLYGLANEGESAASGGSSTTNGKRSRPTSPPTTRSTSATPSSARRR